MSANADEIHEQVRERYAQAAVEASSGTQPGIVSGCGEGGCCAPEDAVFGSALYADLGAGGLPEAAVLASLGCGNPAAWFRPNDCARKRSPRPSAVTPSKPTTRFPSLNAVADSIDDSGNLVSWNSRILDPGK